ncbi:MAG TPA: hypothetical protein VKR61_06690 [Bryobacteraceae bacterium]|nr:hypothetical protein [Bryobacteraceae bacterium]
MKFADLLIASIKRSEIPLRFEPGAEEAVAQPVTELLRAWLEAHCPSEPGSDFDYGQQALIAQLLDEINGARDVPGES